MCDSCGCRSHRDMKSIASVSETRRAFLQGLATLPLAAFLLKPSLASAQTDTTQMFEIVLDDGDSVRGALALPAVEKAPAVLLIHEWWGLNDDMKAKASELASQGFLAFAIDLFDAEPTDDPATATDLVRKVDPEAALQKLVAAIGWLEGHERGNGRIAVVGWGFGGGWCLDASLARPVDATVIYYGAVEKTAAELKTLHGPILGHFATLDESIPREMIDRFATAMEAAGKGGLLQVYWYEARQAFANPSGSRYDPDNARLASDRTLEFLTSRLRA